MNNDISEVIPLPVGATGCFQVRSCRIFDPILYFQKVCRISSGRYGSLCSFFGFTVCNFIAMDFGMSRNPVNLNLVIRQTLQNTLDFMDDVSIGRWDALSDKR